MTRQSLHCPYFYTKETKAKEKPKERPKKVEQEKPVPEIQSNKFEEVFAKLCPYPIPILSKDNVENTPTVFMCVSSYPRP